MVTGMSILLVESVTMVTVHTSSGVCYHGNWNVHTSSRYESLTMVTGMSTLLVEASLLPW